MKPADTWKKAEELAHASEELAAAQELNTDPDANEPAYVSVYSTTQHYGGPEEGGWYYHWYSFIEARQYPTKLQARAVAAELRKLTREENRRRRDAVNRQLAKGANMDSFSMDDPEPLWTHEEVDSALSVLVEATAGENKTTHRPHYE